MSALTGSVPRELSSGGGTSSEVSVLAVSRGHRVSNGRVRTTFTACGGYIGSSFEGVRTRGEVTNAPVAFWRRGITITAGVPNSGERTLLCVRRSTPPGRDAGPFSAAEGNPRNDWAGRCFRRREGSADIVSSLCCLAGAYGRRRVGVLFRIFSYFCISCICVCRHRPSGVVAARPLAAAP